MPAAVVESCICQIVVEPCFTSSTAATVSELPAISVIYNKELVVGALKEAVAVLLPVAVAEKGVPFIFVIAIISLD